MGVRLWQFVVCFLSSEGIHGYSTIKPSSPSCQYSYGSPHLLGAAWLPFRALPPVTNIVEFGRVGREAPTHTAF